MSLTVPLPELLTADSPLSFSGCAVSTQTRSTRRVITPQTGRALEVLAHAIEYLEDTAPLSLEPCARWVAVNEAVQILASLNVTENAKDANRYPDQLEQTCGEFRKVESEVNKKNKGWVRTAAEGVELIKADPQFLLMQTYRYARNAMQKLNSRQRRRYFEDLVGMLLMEQSVTSGMEFQPRAIPEDFKQGPGRPRLVRETKEEVAVGA